MTHAAPANTHTQAWPLGIILAILLQVAAFSFWAGRIEATVKILSTTVDALRHDLSAHMNGK